MSTKGRELATNVGLLAIAGFLPKLFSFILVPVFTSYLSTADYGTFDLLQTTVVLLIPILTLGIQDAVIRFALDDEQDNRIVFSVAFRIFVVGSLFLGIILVILSWLEITHIDNYLLLYLWVSYCINAFWNILSLFARGVDKVKGLTIASVLSSILSLSLSILFLVVFRWSLKGFLLANIIAQLCATVYLSASVGVAKYIKLGKLPFSTAFSMVRYSVPLILNNIAWWATNASNRYILAIMIGTSATGLFAVAGKIPGILSIFQNVFIQAWTISAIKEFDSEDSDGFIGLNYSRFSALMAIICSGLMLMNNLISRLLFANEFYAAWAFVPPLLVAVFFNAMSLFMGSIFVAVKNTKAVAITTVVGGVVNIIANILLIALQGIYGAAISTAISHLAVLGMRHIYARKHIVMKMKWSVEISTYCLLLIQMGLASFATKYIWLQMLVLIAIVIMNRNIIGQVFDAIIKAMTERRRNVKKV